MKTSKVLVGFVFALDTVLFRLHIDIIKIANLWSFLYYRTCL